MSDSEELTDEERMMNLLEELQKENERLKAQQQPLEPLIQTIRQQESKLAGLTVSVRSLNEENEKLLKFAENEKKLNADNERLTKLNAEQERRLKQKDSEIAALQRQNEALAANFDTIANAMPKVEDVERLTKTFKGAEHTISLVNVASWFNTAFVAVFFAIVLFAGYQMYFTHQSAQEAAEAAQNAVQRVEGGLYGTDGYSVLHGSKSSQAVYEATHSKGQ